MDRMSVLMVGTGEYTTGHVPSAVAAADKQTGVIGKTYHEMNVAFESFSSGIEFASLDLREFNLTNKKSARKELFECIDRGFARIL